MPDLLARVVALIVTLASLFVQRSRLPAQVQVIGGILAPARRTAASALRITDHARDQHLTTNHRILSRTASFRQRTAITAAWSSYELHRSKLPCGAGEPLPNDGYDFRDDERRVGTKHAPPLRLPARIAHDLTGSAAMKVIIRPRDAAIAWHDGSVSAA